MARRLSSELERSVLDAGKHKAQVPLRCPAATTVDNQ